MSLNKQFRNRNTSVNKVVLMPKKIYALIALSALLLSIYVPFSQAGGQQAAPQFTISQISGFVGDVVSVSGSGFASECTLTIELFKYGTTTDKSGGFSGEVTIPGDGVLAAGTYDVVAKDSKGNEAHASFTMRPSLTITPTTLPSGAVAHLHGDCLVPGGKQYGMDLILDDKLLQTTDKFPMGVLDIDITIPASTPIGEHTITAAPWGGESASATFRVDKVGTSFTITDVSNEDNHVEGYVGDKLVFSCTGFLPEKEVQICYASAILATAKTDKEGAFNVEFTVTRTAGGLYDLYATDGTNTIHTPFTILPSIVFSPTMAASGATVCVEGNGFSPFPAEDGLTATFDGEKLDINHISGDDEGYFMAYFTVPDALPGPYFVTVTCVADPTIHATSVFGVSSLAVTPENPFGALIAIFACLGAVLIYRKHKRA
jgi:hypothetical protein